MLADDQKAGAGRGARGARGSPLRDLAFSALPVAAAVLDALGIVRERNAAWTQLEERLLDRPLEGSDLPSFLSSWGARGGEAAAALRSLLEGSRDSAAVDVEVSGPSGPRDLELRATAFGAGAARGATVVLLERPERAAGADAERRLSALLDNAFETALLVDPSGVIRYRSPTRARPFGCGPEVVGRNAFDDVHPDDRAQVEEAMRRLVEHPAEPVRLEFRLRHEGGDWGWAEGVGTNLLDDPSVGAIVVNLREITASKETADALKQSWALLDTALESLPAAFWAADTEGRTQLQNTRAREMWGDLIGTRPDEVELPEEVRTTWKDTLRRALAGEVVRREGVYGQGAQARVYESIIAPFRDGARVLGVLGLQIDVTERKKGEEALRRATEQQRAIFEQASDPILIVSADSRIIDVNASLAAFLGYTREELLERTVFDLLAPADVKVARQVAAQLQPGETIRFERTFRREDGTDVPADVRVDVLHDRRRLAVLRDISHRRAEQEIERRVREERDVLLERLQLTLDGLPLGCVVSDADFRIIYVNAAAEQIFGRTFSDVSGKRPFQTYSSEGTRRALEDLFLAIADGESTSHDVIENVGAGGRRLICDWHNTGLRRTDGTLVGVLSVCEDTTERRRAEEALFESQRALATLISNLPGVAYRARPHGDGFAMEFISGRVTDITGHRAEEFLRDPRLHFNELIVEEDRATYERAVRQALERHEPFELTYRVKTRSGEERWVWDQGAGVYAPTGERVAVEGYFTDVTESKRLEEALRQSQKLEAIGRLAGGVAHDFNNLLTVILSSASLAIESLPSPTPAEDEMQIVLDAAQRAGSLTHQLLAFARKQVVEPRVLDLNVLLRGLDAILRRLVGEDVDLSAQLADGLWTVKVDPGQIEQVVVNLVVNARAAMPDGGRITLETRNAVLDEGQVKDRVDVQPGAYVVLSVTDTGVGMVGETLAHIFEPFYTTKEPGKGTGLGLASCYGIVRQAGGDIRVDSEPGRGSAFHVFLPRAVEGGAPGALAQEPAAAPRGGETVLLVEDAPFVMRVATLALKRHGYQVLTAATGAAALELAGRHEGRIDLLVTDVVMPAMSGTELARHMQELRPGIKVLYVSGYTEDEVVHRGVLEEHLAFLPKPFTPDGLARKVRAVIDGEE